MKPLRALYALPILALLIGLWYCWLLAKAFLSGPLGR